VIGSSLHRAGGRLAASIPDIWVIARRPACWPSTPRRSCRPVRSPTTACPLRWCPGWRRSNCGSATSTSTR